MKKRDYKALEARRMELSNDMETFIREAIKENNGRITMPFEIQNEEEREEDNDRVKILVEARHDMPWITVTDLYLNSCDSILADGIDDSDLSKRCGFILYPEHYPDICDFINNAVKLEEEHKDDLQPTAPGVKTKDEINSEIMELACALAEKEMIENHQVLPDDLYDEENYKEEFQDEFNPLYDKYYSRIAGLSGFSM